METTKSQTHIMAKLKSGKDLTTNEAHRLMEDILGDEILPDTQIKEILTLISKKLPELDEVIGFIDSMKSHMIRVDAPIKAIDTCGTGGDKSGSFNVSTAVAILLSAGGVAVAKHGNRAATSKCGSADVLEALHIPIDTIKKVAEKNLREDNFVFLFAPQYHPSLKRLSIIRKELGVPTVFNLLGPILNPAQVKYQLIGTYSFANLELLINVLQRMQSKHAIVLTSKNGLDEASIFEDVYIAELFNGRIERYSINAKNYGLSIDGDNNIDGGDALVNADIIVKSFQPALQSDAKVNTILFNAGIAFYIAEKTVNIQEGISLARSLIINGSALKQLQLLQTK